jgi:DNA-directed RNA polymerase
MIEMRITDAEGQTHSQVAPAFYHTYVYLDGKKVGIIKPNRFLTAQLASTPTLGRGVTTKLAPMLVKPKHWTNWDDGGYWYTREEIMRTRQSIEQRAYLKEAADKNILREIYHGLDILGETCWTVNQRVFDTVVKVWNQGETIGGLPPATTGLEYPPQPTTATWDVQDRMNWIRDCKQVSRAMQNAHSQRCDINYKLEIARAVDCSLQQS